MLRSSLPAPPALDSSCSLPIYLDNKSLIQRVSRFQSRFYHSPTEATMSESDALLQIESLMSSLPLSVSLLHVKSHQDDDVNLEDLPLPAQANVRADALASTALASCSSLSSCPLFPAAVCRVNIASHTITHHLASTICFFRFDRPLLSHVITSQGWSSPTAQAIDWPIFGRLCSARSSRLHFAIKFAHRILPTGAVLHRRNPRESPTCPVCSEHETNVHFLCCQHVSRVSFHVKMLSCIRDLCRQHLVDPILTDILHTGVSSVLTSTSPTFPTLPPPYVVLCESQAAIGWVNLLRGFVSVEWSRLEHAHYHRIGRSDLCSTLSLLVVLKKLSGHIHDLWKFRCDQRHGRDRDDHESERSRQTIQRITELYSLRSSVLPDDRRIFYPTLAQHLTKPQSLLRAWLTNHEDHILASVQSASSSNTTHTRPITFYFQP